MFLHQAVPLGGDHLAGLKNEFLAIGPEPSRKHALRPRPDRNPPAAAAHARRVARDGSPGCARIFRIGAGSRLGMPVANRPVPQIVYFCLLLPFTCRSAHGRRRLRISRAAPPPAARRPGTTPTLRATPPGEDAAPQGHLREPRKLARVA